MRLRDTLLYTSVLCVGSGLVHLFAPGQLLATAAWAYDRLLAVDFQPRPAARTRVRLVGVAVLLVGLLADRARRGIDRVRDRA
ncbi:hypothetical protein [Halobaculum sp. MBLA0143]|uniref:hypothetical protein n=1 Tax=Halobaculum sp. MBLA0143 TaxID=3079933 RepID=UPI00352322D9